MLDRLISGAGAVTDAADRIVARADGIPLYAVEIVRMLVAQGSLELAGDAYRPLGDLADLAVPETLHSLIAARLDALDPADRALLQAAAVLGQSFTVDGLADVSGQKAADVAGQTRQVMLNLKAILDDILSDSRWDITYLGMQFMVEGLALAAFGLMHQITTEPLLKKLLRYVMSDEARHVAFGVLSLQEYYSELTDAELRERQEFAFEVAVRLQRRFAQSEMWERMGVDVKEAVKAMQNAPDRPVFQGMLFSKIVPNCRKLGLLDAGDGWLRERFTELGVIEFEHWVDTGEEYADLDEVAKDRVAAG